MAIRNLIGAFAVAASVFTPAAQAGYHYTDIVSFGDSLSDTGNVFAQTAGAVPPSPPYYDGRYSNGPVALERVSQGLGATLLNYAFGGAMTGEHNADFTPADPPELYNSGLLAQVARYGADVGGVADPNALYVVSGGSNDFLTGDLNDAGAIGTQAILNLGSIVTSLYSMGARHFLLPLLPDLGMVPAVQAAGPVDSAAMTALVADFNLALANTYGMLQTLMPDARFVVFDTFAAQHAVVAGAPANGLTDFSNPRYEGTETTPGPVCADPETHFFWDSTHPSARAHELLGDRILGAVVPEPGTAMLLALALGAAGAARRRTPKQVVAA